MPFCYAPWSNIDISPQGNISPCCKFRHDRYQQSAFNITKNSIQQYLNSDVLSQVRQDFNNGQWPAGCERCKLEEDNHIESKRQLDYQRWEDWYKDYDRNHDGWITASVAFGNTCNLSCITCGPASSSRWQKEYQSLHGVNVKPVHFYKKDFVDLFLDHAPGIRHLDIPGGEPFLSGVAEQMALLENLVESGQSKKVSIHYTTNATIFPEAKWWNLWKHFHEIDLQLSIDAVDHRYEYIRFPAVWSEVKQNIKKYQQAETDLANFRISVSHTVSAYNIYYLDEFVSWCYNQSLPRPWLGRVHTPDYMRPSVWAGSAKQHLIEHLRTSIDSDVLTWANLIENSDDSKLFQSFVEKTHWHDHYRGLDFKKTFPEMARFI